MMVPRSTPRKDASSGSESDTDAPEAISLSQSKKTIQKLDSSREDAIKAVRQSQRMRNKQRDKALKERAERNREVVNESVKKAKRKVDAKEKGKEKEEQLEEGSEIEEEDDDEDDVDDDPNGLEARMLRAMKEAQEEQSGSDDDEESEEEYEGFEGVHLDEDGELGDSDKDSDAHSSADSDSDDEESEEDSDLVDDDEAEDEDGEETPHPPKKSQKTKLNPDHLPDEIFKAAFASQATKRTFNESDTDAPKASASRPSKKRKSNAKPNTPKDLIVGSKAIRILPTSNQPTTPSTMPSRKVKRFIDRTLSLKSGKQRGKGWERRPVNIGVLRRAGGPAANFVRTQA